LLLKIARCAVLQSTKGTHSISGSESSSIMRYKGGVTYSLECVRWSHSQSVEQEIETSFVQLDQLSRSSPTSILFEDKFQFPRH